MFEISLLERIKKIQYMTWKRKKKKKKRRKKKEEGHKIVMNSSICHLYICPV
jgi:hypothetical protein